MLDGKPTYFQWLSRLCQETVRRVHTPNPQISNLLGIWNVKSIGMEFYLLKKHNRCLRGLQNIRCWGRTASLCPRDATGRGGTLIQGFAGSSEDA